MEYVADQHVRLSNQTTDMYKGIAVYPKRDRASRVPRLLLSYTIGFAAIVEQVVAASMATPVCMDGGRHIGEEGWVNARGLRRRWRRDRFCGDGFLRQCHAEWTIGGDVSWGRRESWELTPMSESDPS
jgi:hypothetical protein